MAAPIEVAVCTDSSAQLWSCVVWELHSGANLLTYRGGQAGPRGLTLLNGEYLLAAQLGKNYISAWELQRKVRRRVPGLELRWGCAGRHRLGSTGVCPRPEPGGSLG
ncbi:WD repeat-containing protein 18 [Myotis brandtii]|uniref:WD repeat-containing protein 18 n=1 Tax=Myotis brandtii TaxID=109478 RepID=S7QAU3_MYOBR|nr:WD repeat-containing protein 18 [Myotis brandtii]